jgi:hypothetical protein
VFQDVECRYDIERSFERDIRKASNRESYPGINAARLIDGKLTDVQAESVLLCRWRDSPPA